MIAFRETKPLKDYDPVSLAVMLREIFTKQFPLADVQRLDDAIQVASYLHRNDVRRGARGKHTNPAYIEHPLRVALRMATTFEVRDADVLIAAILHDTVEDHPFEFSDFQGSVLSTVERVARGMALDFIGRHFGYRVASIVEDVSNPILEEGISKADKVKQYQDHVFNVTVRSPDVLILKFSDFVDNAGSLHHHYEPGDPKVKYFLDRYTPLLVMYKRHFHHYGDPNLYNEERVNDRLAEVQARFDIFNAAVVS